MDDVTICIMENISIIYNFHYLKYFNKSRKPKCHIGDRVTVTTTYIWNQGGGF